MVPQEDEADHQAKVDEKVQAYLGISGNCAQTSFITLQEVFDLGGEDIVKALTAFPGIALRGETCGVGMGQPGCHRKMWGGHLNGCPDCIGVDPAQNKRFVM